MGFYDTKNGKRKMSKTLHDKLSQMDDFNFFARETFTKKDKICGISKNLSN